MSTEARVTTLEQAILRTTGNIDRLSQRVDRTSAKVDETTENVKRLSEEMRAFEREMRASSDRADERLAAQSAAMDKRWGELANKMGTLVEDIVAPGTPEIFRTVFGQDLEPDLAVRVRRRHPVDRGRTQEFDAVASGGGIVLVNETRSRLGPQDVAQFLELLAEVKVFLPETRDSRLVGALASFYVDPSVVRAGESKGLLMLGLSRGLLEILNAKDFRPREL